MIRLEAVITNRVPTGVRVGVRLPEIASSMQAGWDSVGPHRSRTNSWSYGPKFGTIRGELGKLSNWKAKTYPNGDVIAEGLIRLDHAGIQNRGGIIPERRVVAPLTRKMRFGYRGKLIFTNKLLKRSVIRGKHYIEAGARIAARRMKAILEVIWIPTKHMGGGNGV